MSEQNKKLQNKSFIFLFIAIEELTRTESKLQSETEILRKVLQTHPTVPVAYKEVREAPSDDPSIKDTVTSASEPLDISSFLNFPTSRGPHQVAFSIHAKM